MEFYGELETAEKTRRLRKCVVSSSRSNCLRVAKRQPSAYIYQVFSLQFPVHNCFGSTMAIKFFLTFVLALNSCEVTLSSDIEYAFTHHQVKPHAVNVVPQEELKVNP